MMCQKISKIKNVPPTRLAARMVLDDVESVLDDLSISRTGVLILESMLMVEEGWGKWWDGGIESGGKD